MDKSKPSIKVYTNVWGLRGFQIGLWVFLAMQFSPEVIASYGLWLAFVGLIQIVFPDGIGVGLLRSDSDELSSDYTISLLFMSLIGISCSIFVVLFRNELSQLFHLQNVIKYFVAYAFLIPISFCSTLAYRVLQRESKFNKIYQSEWSVVLVQIVLLSMVKTYSINLLLSMYLAGELLKSVMLLFFGNKVGQINRFKEFFFENLGLSFWMVINRIGTYAVTRGDIWFLSNVVSTEALAALVLLKQAFAHVKGLLIDPQQVLLMPALARARNREGFTRFYGVIRKRLIISGSLLFISLGLALSIVFKYVSSPYQAFFTLCLVLGLYQASHLYSFPLAQRSLGAGNGIEIGLFRIVFTLVLFLALWFLGDDGLEKTFIIAGLGASVISIIAELYESRTSNIPTSRIIVLVYLMLIFAMLSNFTPLFELGIFICILLFSIQAWTIGGGKLLVRKIRYYFTKESPLRSK